MESTLAPADPAAVANWGEILPMEGIIPVSAQRKGRKFQRLTSTSHCTRVSKCPDQKNAPQEGGPTTHVPEREGPRRPALEGSLLRKGGGGRREGKKEVDPRRWRQREGSSTKKRHRASAQSDVGPAPMGAPGVACGAGGGRTQRQKKKKTNGCSHC